MKAFLEQYLYQKKVLILGFGREGRSTYRVLQAVDSLAELAIADGMATELPADVTVYSGEGYLDHLDEYDVVIKSPGVPLPKHPAEYACHITSQIELFLQRYAPQTVGITGTKGKSTTSSMLYHVLRESGVDCVFGGNIGVPVFDIAEEVTDRSVIVLELSCHQLEHISVAPSVAVLLNLYEDHLDRYGTFEAYCDAKKNIYRRQKPQDVLFCNAEFLPAEGDCSAQVRAMGPDCVAAVEGIPTLLKGTHNRYNMAVVYEICRLLQVDEQKVAAAMATFKPLAHRLEYVGALEGVDYYDDSISTTVESAISAIKSVENIGTVLVGGMERGIDYEPLVTFLLAHPIDNVICMYDSGKRIYDRIGECADGPTATNFVYVPDLTAAVACAREVTAAGKACVLSPAAASYGAFKNFEHRGNVFRALLGFEA